VIETAFYILGYAVGLISGLIVGDIYMKYKRNRDLFERYNRGLKK
jgi:hypothetical protein